MKKFNKNDFIEFIQLNFNTNQLSISIINNIIDYAIKNINNKEKFINFIIEIFNNDLTVEEIEKFIN